MEKCQGYKIRKAREIKNIPQDYMTKQLSTSQSDFSCIEKKEKEEKQSQKRIVMEFGQRVRQIRKDQKISQSQLAFEAELSRIGISCIERGLKNVALETSLAISKAFGMKLKEFFDFEYEEQA